MNQTVAAVKIYQYLKEYPERSFELKDFYDDDRLVQPMFGVENGFTEKTVRTVFENLSEMDTVQKWREAGNRPWKFQYAIPDEPEFEVMEKRTAIIDTISTKQYRDLSFGKNSEDDIRASELVSNLRSRWISYANDMIHLAEPQRVRLDTSMLDHLLELIGHFKESAWSRVFLINENEEVRTDPVIISLIHVLIQDGYVHCYGIFEGEKGLTGDKFFLDQIDHIETGERLVKSKKYMELHDVIRQIRAVPPFFSRDE